MLFCRAVDLAGRAEYLLKQRIASSAATSGGTGMKTLALLKVPLFRNIQPTTLPVVSQILSSASVKSTCVKVCCLLNLSLQATYIFNFVLSLIEL